MNKKYEIIKVSINNNGFFDYCLIEVSTGKIIEAASPDNLYGIRNIIEKYLAQ